MAIEPRRALLAHGIVALQMQLDSSRQDNRTGVGMLLDAEADGDEKSVQEDHRDERKCTTPRSDQHLPQPTHDDIVLESATSACQALDTSRLAAYAQQSALGGSASSKCGLVQARLA